MLEELKSINLGGKKELLYFLRLIGTKSLSVSTIQTNCLHAPAGYRISCDALMKYCRHFEWISGQEVVVLDETLRKYMDFEEDLNFELVKQTVRSLFKSDVFNVQLFNLRQENGEIEFRNNVFPLQYSQIRNMLISQGFLQYSGNGMLVVGHQFQKLVTSLCRETGRKFTLQQLKKKLEEEAAVGARAEKFVLEYEKRRIDNSMLSDKVQIISELDAGAGYDIQSFENDASETPRYIEVKAIGQKGFYWSQNEYAKAKTLGNQYFLYLVEIAKINQTDYRPIIIRNPADTVMNSDDWFIEPASFHVRKI